MRIGLQMPRFTSEQGTTGIAPKLKQIAQTVDQGGFYSLWVMDHFFQIPGVGEPEENMLEGYSALSYFAAATEKVKLGTLVTGVIYRYPGLLVKTATTLDVLSGGRAYFGIGAAWFEYESRSLGVPFPSTGERLEETLQIAHQMWSGETKPYHGKHYQLENAMARPLPISQPHPPIMIGGMGENKTMRLIAQYGDACNFFARRGAEEMQTRLDTIKRNCDEIGRDFNEIERTALDTIDFRQRTPADVIEAIRGLAALGFQHYIFNSPQNLEPQTVDTFLSEVLPAVADL